MKIYLDMPKLNSKVKEL